MDYGDTIAVDPGTRHVAVAWGFRVGGSLTGAQLIRSTAVGDGIAERAQNMALQIATLVGSSNTPRRLVLELPRSYEAAQQKGSQNDLIDLAVVVGAIIGALHLAPGSICYTVAPRDWKGTLSKEKFIETRILPRLEPYEFSRIEKLPKSLLHNVHDAVGLFLHDVGRLQRRMVIAR